MLLILLNMMSKSLPLNVSKKNFSYKKSLKTPDILIKFTGPATRGWGQSTPTHPPTPLFLRCRKKKRETKKKRKSFQAETIKRLSPRSKCYCFSHSRASRIQKLSLSAKRGPTILFSIPWSLHFGILFVGPDS